MSAFLVALDAEIAETEADIQANPDPRVVKLMKLRRLREDHYARNPSPARSPEAAVPPSNGTAGRVGDAALAATYNASITRGGMRNIFISKRASNPQTQDIFSTSDTSDIRSPGRKRSPEREKALQESAAYLENKANPVKTSELVAMLRFKKIEIPGADPVSNLSAMLSNADQFMSHGRAGWTLANTGGRAD